MIAFPRSAIPVAFVLRAFSGYRNSYYTQLGGVRMLEAIRLDYFRKLQVVPLSFLQSKSSGDLLSRGMSDTAQLQFTARLQRTGDWCRITPGAPPAYPGYVAGSAGSDNSTPVRRRIVGSTPISVCA